MFYLRVCSFLFLAVTLLPATQAGAQTSSDTTLPSAVTAFRTWAERYLQAAPAVGEKIPAVAEGLLLAEQRRQALEKLMQSDPGQAVAASLPATLRSHLPQTLADQLETPVSGTGDLVVRGALAATRGPNVEAVRRFVHLNGATYRAYVYGARVGETSKRNIPLHGIILNGKMALAESPLRELGADETPDSGTAVVDVPDTSTQSATAVNPVLAEMGGRIYRFSSPEQLQKVKAAIEESEQTLGSTPAQSAAQIIETSAQRQALAAIPSSWSTGTKRVLIIRIDFSDKQGDPRYIYGGITYTASYVQNFADTQISDYYRESSNGLTDLVNTVTTQLYRMPHPAAYYATLTDASGVFIGDDTLHADAEAAASADYNIESYDRTIVLFSSLGSIPGSQINYGGLADIGGTKLWSNGEFDFRVIAHELGHTYGLYHANLWQVNDGNAISPNGVDSEYADDFDTMGANYANNTATDFNPWFKTLLGWLSPTQVQTIAANGTYRVQRFDQAGATGIVALKIVKDSSHNYWISIRRKFTRNVSMSHGAYVIWGYNYNRQSDLLDMTTPGQSDADAALRIGATFIDSAAGLAFKPVSEGGVAPGEYLDVQVNLGNAVTTGVSPLNSGSVTGAGNYAYGTSVTVAATARPGYIFANWTENGSVVSSSVSYTFTVTSSRSLTANFTSTYSIATIASPNSGGTLSGAGSYLPGVKVKLSAVPAAGYFFVKWMENGSVISTVPSFTFLADANHTFTAIFNRKPNAPTNVSPVDQATNQLLTPTLRASGFSDPDNGNSHSKSEWVLRQAANNKLVFDSGDDAANLTSVSIGTSLNYSTSYKWQVRYADNYGAWSDFSTATSFTTQAAPIPSFVPYRGTYYGSFLPASGSDTFRGTISVTVGANGAFSAVVSTAGVRYALRGVFKGDGTFSGSIPRRGAAAITVNLRLDVSNTTNMISGTIDGESLTADKYLFTKAQPAAEAGAYLISLPHPANQNFPQGNGYGWVSVAATGGVRFVGVLGDGTAVSQSTALGNDGDWTIYLPLYMNQGFISGVVTFSPNSGSYRASGNLQWYKPAAVPKQVTYLNGFNTMVSPAVYPSTPLVLIPNTFPYSTGSLSLGSMTFNLQLNVLAPTAFRRALVYLGSNNLVMNLTKGTGAISGSFSDPNGVLRRFSGLYSPAQQEADGLFLDDGRTGFIRFDAQ